jgi:malate dehydrogenase (oxaloacetate-decarboxylating)(NADP+)
MMNQPSERSTGYERLRNPRLNKGTAFTAAERRKYRLESLLPNMELQAARRRAEIANLGDDLQKVGAQLFYNVLTFSVC